MHPNLTIEIKKYPLIGGPPSFNIRGIRLATFSKERWCDPQLVVNGGMFGAGGV